MSNATRVETEEAKVLAELLKISDFQKEGSQTAQMRQVITTRSYYPSKQASNSLTESLFDNRDFGYAEQEFVGTEQRVAFMNIPLTGPNADGVMVPFTVEMLQAKLAANPKCRIYKILSNHPILTDSQKYSISQGLRTKAEFADAQVARYGESAGEDKFGKLVLDTYGKPQYRATFFSASGKEDQDLRTNVPSDFYTTEQITLELTGEISGNAGNQFVDEEFSQLQAAATEQVAEGQTV